MKKVTIYFKSGNNLSFKCEKFDFDFKQSTGRTVSITGAFSAWLIDAMEIEAITVKDCWF